jgi:hypothetical protein
LEEYKGGEVVGVVWSDDGTSDFDVQGLDLNGFSEEGVCDCLVGMYIGVRWIWVAGVTHVTSLIDQISTTLFNTTHISVHLLPATESQDGSTLDPYLLGHSVSHTDSGFISGFRIRFLRVHSFRNFLLDLVGARHLLGFDLCHVRGRFLHLVLGIFFRYA